MTRQIPSNPSNHEVLEESLSFKPKWYFTKEEIDEHSPSRKDGIDLEHESHLRHMYCSYLQELGMELKVPQVTIATAMMLCHRFFMHQSHAKNHWQTVATSSMFLSCKSEDTPRLLKDLTVVAYKLMYKWDPLAPQKIRQKEVFDKQKQLILLGENLILVNVAFDLNIEHPYKPLIAALKKLDISQKEVTKVAWNFVNDWLRTSLCLQYKPHYIAAGSVFLAAKLHKIKLPSGNGKAWWMHFDVSPKQVEDVIQHMLRLLDHSSNSKKPAPASTEVKIELKRTITKCNQKQQIKAKPENCLSDSGSANSIVEDGDGELIIEDSIQKPECKIVSVKRTCPKIDVLSIRERLKRRKLDRVENKKSGDDLEDDEAWIEREIENGIDTKF